MNIYVYSDESGVFDRKHNDIYVFGGLILLGTEEKNKWSRRLFFYDDDIPFFKFRRHRVAPNFECEELPLLSHLCSDFFPSCN